ncbi:HAMP domain-containing sensor histidine kinase [Frankia sp. BMG5.23]|uniref:sensor histidine kinase n=1 Tax=Frankia sp. BMG5.23 TaxID=683305 RepID=UPI000461F0E7|nr:HAMP domain-containing sensor histidine kinase [Frankia sp. BMG5.23]KDA42754.1 signal transduction histidine kinase [Frankia sp. BMG5.23]
MSDLAERARTAAAASGTPAEPPEPARRAVSAAAAAPRSSGLVARLRRWPWARLLPRTVRLRLTLLYGSLFVLSGAALLAITYLLVLHVTATIQITTTPTGMPETQGGPLNGQPAPPRASSAVASQVHHSYLHQLLVESGIALAIMAVVSIWLGWLVAGRVLRPLRTMTATTLRISQENLHERLDLPGPQDELTDLGDTIDGLLARLETAFEAQRRFVANASHELRTPLTMMRTSLDVAEGKPQPVPREVTVLAGKLREGLDQADRLIENFLTLARAHQGAPGNDAAVSLTGLVVAALAAREPHAAELGVHIHRQLAAVEIIGNPTLLRRLVDNLLDNALRYNHPGGFVHVQVQVRCHPATGGTDDARIAHLTIENAGPPLDDADVQQLGQPFRRLAADRTTAGSVGLGLSIVAAIAAAHDGALHLSARPEGGLRAVITMPLVGRAPVSGVPRVPRVPGVPGVPGGRGEAGVAVRPGGSR